MAYNSSLTSEQVEQKLLGILAKDNTEEYTPSGDYNPATKKYVDDKSLSLEPLIIPYEKLENNSDNVDWIQENVLPSIQQKRSMYVQLEQPIAAIAHIYCSVYDANSNRMLLKFISDIGYGALDNFYIVDMTSKTISPIEGYICYPNQVLTRTNTTEYTPTDDYNPATKKYVDDNKPKYRTLTETEYTQLGSITETDNVLYFVTPD